MTRGWPLVLCLVLLVWRPLDFIKELLQTLPSLGMRGLIGGVELFLHGAVAAIAVAAVRAISIGMPAARTLAAVAVIASAAATVQSLYWSVLPHQTVPGDERVLAAIAVANAVIWLAYLARSTRMRGESETQP